MVASLQLNICLFKYNFNLQYDTNLAWAEYSDRGFNHESFERQLKLKTQCIADLVNDDCDIYGETGPEYPLGWLMNFYDTGSPTFAFKIEMYDDEKMAEFEKNLCGRLQ